MIPDKKDIMGLQIISPSI